MRVHSLSAWRSQYCAVAPCALDMRVARGSVNLVVMHRFYLLHCSVQSIICPRKPVLCCCTLCPRHENVDRLGESGGDAPILLVAYKAFRICLQKPILRWCALHSGHEAVRAVPNPVTLVVMHWSYLLRTKHSGFACRSQSCAAVPCTLNMRRWERRQAWCTKHSGSACRRQSYNDVPCTQDMRRWEQCQVEWIWWWYAPNLLVANKTFRICLQKPVLCCCALHSWHEAVRVATGLVNVAMTKVGSSLQSIGHLQHSFLGLIQVLRKDKKQWHHQPVEHTVTKEQANSFWFI